MELDISPPPLIVESWRWYLPARAIRAVIGRIGINSVVIGHSFVTKTKGLYLRRYIHIYLMYSSYGSRVLDKMCRIKKGMLA
jgi:hypothetical protein